MSIHGHDHEACEGCADVEAIRDCFTVRALQNLRPVAVNSYARASMDDRYSKWEGVDDDGQDA